MADDLKVVSSQDLPELSVKSSAALPDDAGEQEPSAYSQITASYNPKIEELAQKHPIIGPILRFLDATGGAVLSTPESIAKGIRDAAISYATGGTVPTDTQKAVEEGISGWADPNVRRGALSVLPEALGQGVGAVAGSEGLNAITGKLTAGSSAAIGKARFSANQLVRDPVTGRIKTPHELIGEALLGGDPYAPGAFPAKPIPKGTNYGQFLESQKLAAKNAPPPVATSPFAGMTSSAQPGGANLQLPPPSEIPRGSQSLFEQSKAQFVKKFSKPTAEPETSRIISPEEASKPLHVEGSYWSFKEPALRKAVLGGDREAAIVYKQRFGSLPTGASYLTDVGSGTTRGLYRSARD